MTKLPVLAIWVQVALWMPRVPLISLLQQQLGQMVLKHTTYRMVLITCLILVRELLWYSTLKLVIMLNGFLYLNKIV